MYVCIYVVYIDIYYIHTILYFEMYVDLYMLNIKWYIDYTYLHMLTYSCLNYYKYDPKNLMNSNICWQEGHLKYIIYKSVHCKIKKY